MSSLCKLTCSLIILISMASLLSAMVPPHPNYVSVPAAYDPIESDSANWDVNGLSPKSKTVPQDILVLRVQFSDVQFQNTAQYPDYLAHNTAFFDRWLLHLGDFYNDASHGTYNPIFTLHPTVFTLPQAMDYYGSDVADTIDVNLKDFILELITLADPGINFHQYDGVMIFHAGPGQESDISSIRTGTVWSTILTRKRLQSYFDPENDNYEGMPTTDGAILTNIIIVPESEFQDYFPGEEEDEAGRYLFSIYGVLAHNFGRLIGLPSLFDNDSSNGRSQGIGNWGLMGTGIWNGFGYVPAQLDPWCRTYLGWEPVINITQSMTDIPVDYFLDHMAGRIRLYKIPISDTEYFLVENRQQNPDGSLDPYSNQPSYTFKLLPEGEQDYYENYPLLPYFNFMENRYIGSEWDFQLPGLGGPIPIGMGTLIDGSGLMIWHIDENIIAENFTPNFDLNYVNANAVHKGIDIEEADGIQNLDTAASDQYKYGGPYDTFREGNNDYFGYQTHNGVLSLPTAESYYGGVSVEIYDISASAKQMTFSVNFDWKLTTQYSGTNNINASMIDFDGDGDTEIFYPMPDGHLYIWKDELLLPGYPLSRTAMQYNYVWDGTDIYIPMQINNLARLYRLSSSSGEYEATFADHDWAGQPVADEESVFLALNSSDTDFGVLQRYTKATGQLETLKDFEYPINTNMVLFRNLLYIPTWQEGSLCMWKYNTDNGEFSSGIIDIPADSMIVGIYKAPIIPHSQNGELVIQFANSVYVYNENLMLPSFLPAKKDLTKTDPLGRDADVYTLADGFPYIHDMHSTAPLTIADWDINGSLDLIITSDLGVAVIDYSGSRMSPSALNTAAIDDDSITSSPLVSDIDHDGSKELIGNFAYNRLSCWEDDFRSKTGYPVSFGSRSRNMPLIGKASDDKIYIWAAADNGSIYRKELPDAVLADIDTGWNCEYGNLMRHASRDHTTLPNQYQSNSLFVKDEVYIYPNPLKSIYENKLTLNVMTNRDASIDVKIFDISGTLIYRLKSSTKAYLRNRDLIDLPEGKIHSGVYIAVISADTDSCRLKFAVEK